MALGIISHDAGGAEILSSYVARHRPDCVFALEGPALRIFERKLYGIKALGVEDVVERSRSILCGTSWESDLEWRAIGLARSKGKQSAAFLDHWANYRERFIRRGQVNLPDEIWVGDDFALALGRQALPEVPVKFVENPYFSDLREEMQRGAGAGRIARTDGRVSILYVCEPLGESAKAMFDDERHWGYTEQDALRYFLGNIGALGRPVERIVIRPHPSERADKYRWAAEEFKLPIVVGGARSLLEEIAQSDIVVGCDSMAMVIGLLAGKRVISCIPPGGEACSLPQTEIESLQRLLAPDCVIFSLKR